MKWPEAGIGSGKQEVSGREAGGQQGGGHFQALGMAGNHEGWGTVQAWRAKKGPIISAAAEPLVLDDGLRSRLVKPEVHTGHLPQIPMVGILDSGPDADPPSWGGQGCGCPIQSRPG